MGKKDFHEGNPHKSKTVSEILPVEESKGKKKSKEPSGNVETDLPVTEEVTE